MSGAMKFLCHIPEDMIANILSRLPVKPILRFRCVCKFWSNLTTDPNFIRMHLDQAIKNNNFSLFINPFNYGPLGEIACVDEDPSSSLAQELPSPSSFSSSSPLMSPLPLLLPSPSLSQSQSQSQLPISVSSISSQPYFQVDLPTSHVEAIEIDYPFKYSRSNVELLGSCNGLVCIKWYKGEYLCVWNPFTNEYKEIPKQLPTQFPRDSRIHGINAYGFGCDCNNKNYKIVRIITSESEEYDSEVHVYTFESDCWTIIEPTPFGTQERLRGMLVKGVLYFLSKHTNLIFYFDIVSERFNEMAIPLPYLLEDPFATEIGVLQGDLCLVGHCFQIRVDLWTMKVYGNEFSWTKMFSIDQPSILRSLNYRRPIQICKNGEILIEVIFQEEDDYGLVLYDPKTESGRLIKMCGNTDGWNDVQDYVGTLVSLKSGTYCGGRRSKPSKRSNRGSGK